MFNANFVDIVNDAFLILLLKLAGQVGRGDTKMLGDRSEIHIRIHIIVFNKAADISSPSAALFIFYVRSDLITCLAADCADVGERIRKRIFEE